MLVWVSHNVFFEWRAGFINLGGEEAICLCGLSRIHMQQGPTASASLIFTLEGMAAQRRLFIMRSFFLLFFSLLLVSQGSSAVITGVSGSKWIHTSLTIKELSCDGNMQNKDFSMVFFKENVAWCLLLHILLVFMLKYFALVVPSRIQSFS